MKKIPLRRCILNNQMFPKTDLFRIVKTPGGLIQIDLTGKANGRGAYLKKDLPTIQKAKQRKVLDKAFECQVDVKIYEELEKLLWMKVL